jgi:hypothetical protein
MRSFDVGYYGKGKDPFGGTSAEPGWPFLPLLYVIELVKVSYSRRGGSMMSMQIE